MRQKKQPIKISKEGEQKLRYFGVAALYLFGSRAQGVAGPISDFDFGVILRDPKKIRVSDPKLYNKLYDVLSDACPSEAGEEKVIDIVFLDSPRVPLELKFNIIRFGQVFFDEEPARRADREEKIMEAYCDFKPVLDMFDQAILARI